MRKFDSDYSIEQEMVLCSEFDKRWSSIPRIQEKLEDGPLVRTSERTRACIPRLES